MYNCINPNFSHILIYSLSLIIVGLFFSAQKLRKCIKIVSPLTWNDCDPQIISTFIDKTTIIEQHEKKIQANNNKTETVQLLTDWNNSIEPRYSHILTTFSKAHIPYIMPKFSHMLIELLTYYAQILTYINTTLNPAQILILGPKFLNITFNLNQITYKLSHY